MAALVAETGGRRRRALRGVHDVSAGGLGVALAEMAVAVRGRGPARPALDGPAELFCELPSRVLVATARPAELLDRAAAAGVAAGCSGAAGGDRLVIDGLVDLDVGPTGVVAGALPRALAGRLIPQAAVRPAAVGLGCRCSGRSAAGRRAASAVQDVVGHREVAPPGAHRQVRLDRPVVVGSAGGHQVGRRASSTEGGPLVGA